MSRKTLSITKLQRISNIRSKQKHKHLTKKRNTKQIKKTKQIQKGGFNETIKNYIHFLGNKINTYDVKLMLIYTYLNNQELSTNNRQIIEKYMRIPSFGKGITIEEQKVIFKNINTILSTGSEITSVIRMEDPIRYETRNWQKWLDIKRGSNLPSPSDLLPPPIISKIKQKFNNAGILLETLEYLLLPSGYTLRNGKLINSSGNNVYASPNGQASPTLFHNDKELLPLTHLWFKEWPDHGVPADLTSYCNFIKYIYNHILQFGGGSIIHCSAGVGRTGVVYITLNLLFEFGINPNDEFPLTKVPAGFTKDLVLKRIMTARGYRMALVQTIEQFSFILRCFGFPNLLIIELDISNIQTNQNPNKYLTSISQQNSAIKSKNRYSNILPYDNNIVKTLQTSDNSSGYINASFAPCVFPSKIPQNMNCPNFILAQCPIPNTIIDFQNMIRLYQIRRIIMVTCLEEGSVLKCNDYLALKSTKPTTINSEFKLLESSNLEFGAQQEYTYKRYNESHRARANSVGSSSSA